VLHIWIVWLGDNNVRDLQQGREQRCLVFLITRKPMWLAIGCLLEQPAEGPCPLRIVEARDHRHLRKLVQRL
jgi:hypothetical protein